MKSITDFTVHSRNLLPWQLPGSICFVTWRTRAGLKLPPECRSAALNAVVYQHSRRWHVHSAVVMPDHVRVLARPSPLDPSSLTDPTTHDLGAIIQNVKRFSAHRVNRLLARSGAVWQDERYDRIVRDEREFEETVEYTRNDPVAAGLVTSPEADRWYFCATDHG